MLSIQTDEFLEAIQKGNVSKVSQLLGVSPALANGKSPNGVSVILLALYYGHRNIAEAIASKKSELDIFEAATLGRLNAVKSILSQNPSLVSLYSSDGFPPVALAAYLGQKDVTEYLIENGADVNAPAKNSTGFTALTGAVANNHVEIAKKLVKKGAQVNYSYEGGVTPLMEACQNGNADLVDFLLANGSDPNARTSNGKSPMSLASEKKHAEVIEILKKHGAL